MAIEAIAILNVKSEGVGDGSDGKFLLYKCEELCLIPITNTEKWLGVVVQL